MSIDIDYYDLLEATRDADGTVIKANYRRLAMQFHPDKNPGDAAAEARFKAISEAYDVLKDPQKRAAYDQYGKAAFQQGGGGGGQGFEGFSDIFENIFGEFMGRGRNRGPQRGADLRYDLEMTLEEAFEGKDAALTIDVSVTCEPCTGSGAKPGTSAKPCTTCNGQGRVHMRQGLFMVERTCPACHGSGQIIADPCDTCHGAGRVEKEKTLSVNVPRGVDDGTRIRVAGEGEAGMRGGPAGDLYIFIEVKDHAIFIRDGRMLACQVPVSMATAALGGEIEVPTIDGGRSRVKVPAGTQSGKQLRLRGKGMPPLRHGPGLNGESGDMLIELSVETPVNLTSRQKEILREFDTLATDNNPEGSTFFSKVKGFWDGIKH